MYLAYETLSEPMKALLGGVKTWNVGDRKKLSQSDKMGSAREGRYVGNEKMAAKVQDPGDLQTEVRAPSRAHASRDAAARPSTSATTRRRSTASSAPRRGRSSTS